MARRKIRHLPGKDLRSIATSVGFGLPIIVIGVLGFASDTLSLQLTLWAVLVGVMVVTAGLAISRISVPFVRLMRDETKYTARHPSLKPPFARILLSIPFFVVSGYVIGFTNLPYVVSFIPFVIGTYLYFRGVTKFWINQHTIYFVTNRGRVGHVYRFLGLSHNEIRINATTSIGQTKTLFEMITGRGNILVSNGPASSHQVHWQEVNDSSPVVGLLKGHIARAARR